MRSQNVIVEPRGPAACPHCGGPVAQDEDVLDTWFSSLALADLHARLAERERRRPAHLLSDRRPRHRARDPLLLGRADDHGRATRSWATRRSTACTCTAPCATRRHARCPSRSATASTRSTSWSSTAPTRCATRSSPAWGSAPTSSSIRRSRELVRARREFRDEALEHRPLHPHQSRRAHPSPRRLLPGRRSAARSCRWPIAGSSPGATRRCVRPPRPTSGSGSTRPPRRCTASSGATSPTGTSSRSSPALRRSAGRRRRPRGRDPDLRRRRSAAPSGHAVRHRSPLERPSRPRGGVFHLGGPLAPAGRAQRSTRMPCATSDWCRN